MSLKIKLDLDNAGFKKTLKNSESKFKQFSKSLETRSAALKSSLLGSAAAVTAVGLSVSKLIKEAAKMETITTQFEVLTGSVSKAKTLMEELTDFTSRTPFQFEGVAKAAQTLLGFGLSVEKVKEQLPRIGDVAAAVGVNFKDLAVIFGQVRAAGKLTGERLNQLQEKSVPIGAALAKTLGVAETEVRELVSKGVVNFKVFEKAFASLSKKGGLAFDAMSKRSKTLEGVISTTKDNIQLFAVALGTQLLSDVKAVTKKINEFFIMLGKDKATQDNIIRFIKLASVLLAAKLAITGLSLAVTLLGIKILKMNSIAALSITIFKGAKASILLFSAAARASIGVMSLLKIAFTGLAGATGVGLFIILLPKLSKLFRFFWNDAYGATSTTVKSLMEILNALGRAFKGAFTSTIKSLIEILKALGRAFKGAFTFNWSELKAGLADAKAAFKGFSEQAETSTFNWSEVKAGLADAKAAFKGFSEEVEASTRDPASDEIQEEVDKQNEKMDALHEAKMEKAAEQKEEENEKKKEGLTLEQEVEKEDRQRRDAFEKERRKQFIRDEKRHGKTFAKLKESFNTLEYKQAEDSAIKLAYLRRSNNALSKNVGRAASITQILLDAPRAAMGAYAALAPIPFVGPALGAAAAAAALLYSKEQLVAVREAQTGGLVTRLAGTPAIGDHQPFLLEPGENIQPRDDVRLQRKASMAILDALGTRGGDDFFEDDTQNVNVELDLSDSASDVVFASRIQRQELGYGVT